ncbi:hypothetical protein DM02DRAFT_660502 [Periconia macrospinosa]|uniref:Uncharacterized protein n=1 Tax=Periconia macrospinosa TaxID=97972 RepID=A0A2V1DAC8_9PLEO|nr:hypothetical protein DM02DRAFT_660502 [Periconia macrospinosa]
MPPKKGKKPAAPKKPAATKKAPSGGRGRPAKNANTNDASSSATTAAPVTPDPGASATAPVDARELRIQRRQQAKEAQEKAEKEKAKKKQQQQQSGPSTSQADGGQEQQQQASPSNARNQLQGQGDSGTSNQASPQGKEVDKGKGKGKEKAVVNDRSSEAGPSHANANANANRATRHGVGAKSPGPTRSRSRITAISTSPRSPTRPLSFLDSIIETTPRNPTPRSPSMLKKASAGPSATSKSSMPTSPPPVLISRAPPITTISSAPQKSSIPTSSRPDLPSRAPPSTTSPSAPSGSDPQRVGLRTPRNLGPTLETGSSSSKMPAKDVSKPDSQGPTVSKIAKVVTVTPPIRSQPSRASRPQKTPEREPTPEPEPLSPTSSVSTTSWTGSSRSGSDDDDDEENNSSKALGFLRFWGIKIGQRARPATTTALRKAGIKKKSGLVRQTRHGHHRSRRDHHGDTQPGRISHIATPPTRNDNDTRDETQGGVQGSDSLRKPVDPQPDPTSGEEATTTSNDSDTGMNVEGNSNDEDYQDAQPSPTRKGTNTPGSPDRDHKRKRGSEDRQDRQDHGDHDDSDGSDPDGGDASRIKKGGKKVTETVQSSKPNKRARFKDSPVVGVRHITPSPPDAKAQAPQRPTQPPPRGIISNAWRWIQENVLPAQETVVIIPRSYPVRYTPAASGVHRTIPSGTPLRTDRTQPRRQNLIDNSHLRDRRSSTQYRRPVSGQQPSRSATRPVYSTPTPPGDLPNRRVSDLRSNRGANRVRRPRRSASLGSLGPSPLATSTSTSENENADVVQGDDSSEIDYSDDSLLAPVTRPIYSLPPYPSRSGTPAPAHQPSGRSLPGHTPSPFSGGLTSTSPRRRLQASSSSLLPSPGLHSVMDQSPTPAPGITRTPREAPSEGDPTGWRSTLIREGWDEATRRRSE